MAITVVGTVPYEGFPLIHGKCSYANGRAHVGAESVPALRGTPALLAAACLSSDALGLDTPTALLAGDVGRGDGSKLIYAHLVKYLSEWRPQVMVFHYLQPDVDWHNRILIRIDELENRPILVADAGYMYVAKMSGFAVSYDLFTPDAGEIAFLADESAPHPFYTRGYLLQEEDKVPELIQRAYEHENAARCLLVKGKKDIVASASGICAEISAPCVENMEPIGGTGDSLTGIVAALISQGRSVVESAALGAAVNRTVGSLANPTPAWSIADLLPWAPEALLEVLSQK